MTVAIRQLVSAVVYGALQSQWLSGIKIQTTEFSSDNSLLTIYKILHCTVDKVIKTNTVADLVVHGCIMLVKLALLSDNNGVANEVTEYE